jgi:tRNA/rRNA methyltransferase
MTAPSTARIDPADVVVVLCHPADPRNVGACVRAVANFGLGGLRLVSTNHDAFPEEALHAFSATSLVHVRLTRWDTVPAALADVAFAVGTSRRHHGEDAPLHWPAAGLGTRLAGRGRVALVFGHERNGLSREELDACDAVVSIPTGEAFASLNLGHAVACLGYELTRPETSGWADPRPRAPSAATTATRVSLFREIEAVCDRIGYPPGRSGRAFARRLRRLLTRADASPAEWSLVAGLFRELARRGEPEP